jgi:hypothetical protein
MFSLQCSCNAHLSGNVNLWFNLTLQIDPDAVDASAILLGIRQLFFSTGLKYFRPSYALGDTSEQPTRRARMSKFETHRIDGYRFTSCGKVGFTKKCITVGAKERWASTALEDARTSTTAWCQLIDALKTRLSD